jgi:hypothetical protein
MVPYMLEYKPGLLFPSRLSRPGFKTRPAFKHLFGGGFYSSIYGTHIRGQSNEREDGDIVSHADDEDEPESEGKVFDVLEADLLSRPVLFPLEDPLGSTVKQTKEHGTEKGHYAESKTYISKKNKTKKQLV